MNEALKEVVEALATRCGGEASEFRGDTRVVLSPGSIVEACQVLRKEFQFEYLADLTASDYWPQMEPRFHVVYQVRSVAKNLIITLRVPVSGEEPAIPTVEGVYPNANWHERELWDMFGIHISGHSDLRRILLPHDWEGHPLRKDYPLGYEEVQFTFNSDEIDARKDYARKLFPEGGPDVENNAGAK